MSTCLGRKERRAVCIFLYECDIRSLSLTFRDRIIICDEKKMFKKIKKERERENNNDVEVTKSVRRIVPNAAKFCLKPSG